MTRKTARKILIFPIVFIAMFTPFKMRSPQSTLPDSAKASQTELAENPTTSQPVVSPLKYELILIENILYYNSYAGDNSLLAQETIDYINIYSLYPDQLSLLKSGMMFNSKEELAAFIQDLGS